MLAACGAAPTPAPVHTPPAEWTALTSGTSESLRGLSVVSAEIVWASGTHGTVVHSIDGGASWRVSVVPDADALDFRSLHAFDRERALVLSAGSPARAFLTRDGGLTWTETYTREGEGVFFDSLAFRDASEGLAIGDPLPAEDGPHFVLLVTHDGGTHWEERVGPRAEVGEAAFAASNGCLAFLGSSGVIFATGGSAARTFRSIDDAATWSSASAPIASSASAGIFALAFEDAQIGYAVGGDYAAPTDPGSFARTSDGGLAWTAGASPRGYRSSIAIAPGALIVVGSSGSDISRDDGNTWTPIGDTPLNAVRIAGDIAFAVGPEGRLARLSLRAR